MNKLIKTITAMVDEYKEKEIKEYLIISTIDSLKFMVEEGIEKNEYIILKEEEIVLNMYENNALPKKIKEYMEMQLGKEDIKKYLKMKINNN